MSAITTHYCDMKDCHEKALEYLELPEMTIKAFTTDGHGTIIVASQAQRFDVCSKHMESFLNSTFAQRAKIAREKKLIQQ